MNFIQWFNYYVKNLTHYSYARTYGFIASDTSTVGKLIYQHEAGNISITSTQSVYEIHWFYVKSLTVLSTPQVSIHGCVG